MKSHCIVLKRIYYFAEEYDFKSYQLLFELITLIFGKKYYPMRCIFSLFCFSLQETKQGVIE